jgi:hypothetical protein
MRRANRSLSHLWRLLRHQRLLLLTRHLHGSDSSIATWQVGAPGSGVRPALKSGLRVVLCVLQTRPSVLLLSHALK